MSPLPAPRSLWHAHTAPPAFPSLAGDRVADVVVVGAGITGLTTAAALHAAGVDVVVVEAQRVGTGTTGRSTGHLTQLVDALYRDVRKDFGREGARLLAQATGDALVHVEETAARHGVDARLCRVPGYYYTEHEACVAEVEAEFEAAREAGVPGLARVEATPLPMPVRAAFRADHQAQFDPYAYVAGLARALAASGVPIYEHTRVEAFEHAGEGVRLATPAGTVQARRVVFATHTPLGISPLHTLVAPYRSYVLAFRLPGGVPEGVFSDTTDPYWYTRNAVFGGESLLVVGGADHKTGVGGEDAGPYHAVRHYVETRYPGAEAVARWSEEVFESVDGLPFIGPSPMQAGVFAATGYGGDGLTFGTVAGCLLADLVQGRAHPYADLFNPTRVKPLAGGPAFLKENADVAVRLVTGRFATDAIGVEALGPGHGALVDVDGQHVAAYRDDEGGLHLLNPTCRHMGCAVRWNGADRTWDCPCHGARYAPTGEVIAGPATRGLAPAGDPAPLGAG